MDIIPIQQRIETLIDKLEKVRASIRERGEDRAQAATDYDMMMAQTLIGLRNGKEYELNGERICNPPATIMKEIAKGLCWESKLASEKADALYKSAITNQENIMAQLNAFQSLFRHLER